MHRGNRSGFFVQQCLKVDQEHLIVA